MNKSIESNHATICQTPDQVNEDLNLFPTVAQHNHINSLTNTKNFLTHSSLAVLLQSSLPYDKFYLMESTKSPSKHTLGLWLRAALTVWL